MKKCHSFFFSLFTAIILSTSNIFAQVRSIEFTELDSLQAIEKRNIVVFLHTDWCNYCHYMKNITFKNDRVVELLNNNFYFIDLNAESKKDINYRGHTFKYKPTGLNTGVHELAEQLGLINGKINYPSIAIINIKNEVIFQYAGLMDSNTLSQILNKIIK